MLIFKVGTIRDTIFINKPDPYLILKDWFKHEYQVRKVSTLPWDCPNKITELML